MDPISCALITLTAYFLTSILRSISIRFVFAHSLVLLKMNVKCEKTERSATLNSLVPIMRNAEINLYTLCPLPRHEGCNLFQFDGKLFFVFSFENNSFLFFSASQTAAHTEQIKGPKEHLWGFTIQLCPSCILIS